MVYCWRGGQRSRSLAIILKEIGFQPTVVRGGYKEYRRMVRSSLFDLSPAATLAQFRLVRVSGATGSGKSQLLEALRARELLFSGEAELRDLELESRAEWLEERRWCGAEDCLCTEASLLSTCPGLV